MSPSRAQDLSRSRLPRILALLVFLALVLAPVLSPGARTLDTAAQIAILVLLAASFDLILGHARLVSLAHVTFFGIGAYAVAIAPIHFGRGYEALVAGALAGAVSAAVLAVVIGVFALRARGVVFSMITLTVAVLAPVLVAQYQALTGGTEGLVFDMPQALGPEVRYGAFPQAPWPGPLPADMAEHGIGGQKIDGRTIRYYVVVSASITAFLIILRVANTRFVSAMAQAPETAGPAEAFGIAHARSRIAVTVLSAIFAALAGALHAFWSGHVGPEDVLGFDLMITILVAVLIGGIGTIWGTVIGAVLLVTAQTYMPALTAAAVPADVTMIQRLLDPDRALLWLGIVLVVGVHVFPRGIAGGFGRTGPPGR